MDGMTPRNRVTMASNSNSNRNNESSTTPAAGVSASAAADPAADASSATTPLLVPTNSPSTAEEEADYEVIEHRNDRNDRNDNTNNNNTRRTLLLWQIQIKRRARQLVALLLSPLQDEHGSAPSVAIGLAVLVLMGSILGAVSPKNTAHNHLNGTWYPLVSSCIGYTYFLMWSVSFYPQAIANWRRQTTTGLSADFAALNVFGFACYTAYNTAMYFSTSIHRQYRERHGSQDAQVTVQSNDVAFAVHALLLSSLTLAQIAYYDHRFFFSRRGRASPSSSAAATQHQQQHHHRPSQLIGTFLAIMLSMVILYPILLWVLSSTSTKYSHYLNTLDYLYLLSYMKMAVTLVKYVPQVVLNARRQSTAGWSVWQILLDFGGGLLSDAQLVLDCWNLRDWSGLTGNLAKLFLGSVSIVFDVIFLLQHYVLYPPPRSNNGDEMMQEEDAVETAAAAAAASLLDAERNDDKRDDGDAPVNEGLIV